MAARGCCRRVAHGIRRTSPLPSPPLRSLPRSGGGEGRRRRCDRGSGGGQRGGWQEAGQRSVGGAEAGRRQAGGRRGGAEANVVDSWVANTVASISGIIDTYGDVALW
uniref:Uncharacterized protein n=1 Tax=Oryza nivara TaxID=4536 RepID=A0A0E0IHW8_ORYNI